MFVLQFTGKYYDRRREECGLCDGYHSSLSGCHRCADAEAAEEEEEKKAREIRRAEEAEGERCFLCETPYSRQAQLQAVEFAADHDGVSDYVFLCPKCFDRRETMRLVTITVCKAEDDDWEDHEHHDTYQKLLDGSEKIQEFVDQTLANLKAAGTTWNLMVVDFMRWDGATSTKSLEIK